VSEIAHSVNLIVDEEIFCFNYSFSLIRYDVIMIKNSNNVFQFKSEKTHF
jgi:hypothetical protein